MVKSHDLSTEISTDDLFSRFYSPDATLNACQLCKIFNKQWSCPPFNYDVESLLRSFSRVMIIATRIDLGSDQIPVSEAERLMLPHKQRLHDSLMKMERESGGRASLTIGRCTYCGDNECSRLFDLPCRHPELVRPSLEAYGFDITAIMADLFNIPLQWGKTPYVLPSTLTLVTALFHNRNGEVPL